MNVCLAVHWSGRWQDKWRVTWAFDSAEFWEVRPLLSFVPVSGQLMRYIIVLDTKNYLYRGGLCYTRKAQLLMITLVCKFIQLLFLVLTWNLFCLDLALISGLPLDSVSEPSLYQWEIFVLFLRISRCVKHSSCALLSSGCKYLLIRTETASLKSPQTQESSGDGGLKFSFVISSARKKLSQHMNLDILALCSGWIFHTCFCSVVLGRNQAPVHLVSYSVKQRDTTQRIFLSPLSLKRQCMCIQQWCPGKAGVGVSRASMYSDPSKSSTCKGINFIQLPITSACYINMWFTSATPFPWKDKIRYKCKAANFQAWP